MAGDSLVHSGSKSKMTGSSFPLNTIRVSGKAVYIADSMMISVRTACAKVERQCLTSN